MPSQDEHSTNFHAKRQSHSESIAERNGVAHHATLRVFWPVGASQRETWPRDFRAVETKHVHPGVFIPRKHDCVSYVSSVSSDRILPRPEPFTTSPNAGSRRAFPTAG